MHLSEKFLSTQKIYDGKIIKLKRDTVELEDGSVALREVITHPGGVCVLPLDDELNVYVVEQFRYPQNRITLEIPAGKLEYGEDHFECGKRELKEEIGAEAEKYVYLGELCPTPAYDTEIIHMYLATGLKFSERSLDEDEFLDVKKLPLKELKKLCMNGKIKDAKTQAAVLKAYIMHTEGEI